MVSLLSGSKLVRKRCPYCGSNIVLSKKDIVELLPWTLANKDERRCNKPISKITHHHPLPNTRERYQCNNRNCQKVLPERFDELDTKILLIAGLNRSGKTTFIASSLTEIKGSAEPLRYRYEASKIVSVVAIDDTDQMLTEVYCKNYSDWFAGKKKAVLVTPLVNITPLTFIVTTNCSDPYILLVFDIPGEWFRNDTNRLENLRYSTWADAIIFIADPLQMVGIKDEMTNHIRGNNALPVGLGVNNYTDVDIAERIRIALAELEPIAHLQDLQTESYQHIVDSRRAAQTPNSLKHLALVITKCDLLTPFEKEILKDPAMNSSATLDAKEKNSAELLAKYSQNGLLRITTEGNPSSYLDITGSLSQRSALTEPL